MEAKVIINRWSLYEKIKNNSSYTRMDVLIDHEVVETLKCDLCGKPMEYQGFGKNLDWGILYRYAFAICLDCKFAVSF